MNANVFLWSLLASTCLLSGCDTFREVDLVSQKNADTTLISSDAKGVDRFVDAVKKVAAEKQLRCVEHPSPEVPIACGPWFHNISVTLTDGSPTIELHLAHSGWSLGHDPDCDTIADLTKEFQILLADLNVTNSMGKCGG